MCIRDRIELELVANFDIVESVERRATLVASGDFPHIILESVSYTHLRAHETVLDLVCRLLLEKKKKTPYTNAIHYLKKIRHKRDNSIITIYYTLTTNTPQ